MSLHTTDGQSSQREQPAVKVSVSMSILVARLHEGGVHDAGQDICSRIAGHWTPFSTLHWLTETTFNSSVSQPVSIRPCATYELASVATRTKHSGTECQSHHVQLMRTNPVLLSTNTIVIANSEFNDRGG